MEKDEQWEFVHLKNEVYEVVILFSQNEKKLIKCFFLDKQFVLTNRHEWRNSLNFAKSQTFFVLNERERAFLNNDKEREIDKIL